MHNLYFTCPKEADNKIQVVENNISNWINSPEFLNILKAFSVNKTNISDLNKLVDWCVEISDIWDYRKKQSSALDKNTKEAARWLIDSNKITTEQSRVVLEAVSSLGLSGITSPSLHEYDYIVALGGARLSCLLRPKYAAFITQEANITPKSVVLLSGNRPISNSEREATDTYAKDAKTEFDLMNRGGEISFQLENDFEETHYFDENINKSWAIRTYKTDHYPFPIISLAAPSSEPELRRANSVDTYKFFFKRFAVPERAKLLLITSQIYVPYQQLEAIRTLAIPYNVFIETIGFPSDWSGQLHGMGKAVHYLQEIRSTLQAAQRFLRTYHTSNERIIN